MNKQLTLHDIRLMRDNFAKDLIKLIGKFNEDSGVKIKYIAPRYITLFTENGSKTDVISYVDIDLDYE